MSSNNSDINCSGDCSSNCSSNCNNNCNVFRLYIDKQRKEITVINCSDYGCYFFMNYYKDTIDHRIPHVLHKALTDKVIIPAVDFDLVEVYAQCKKYFVRVTNDFPELYVSNMKQEYIFDSRYLMLYDIMCCNIIVNNTYILPAMFVNDGISKLAFKVILENLDRHIAEYKYNLLFPKSFHMDLTLNDRIWTNKIY